MKQPTLIDAPGTIGDIKPVQSSRVLQLLTGLDDPALRRLERLTDPAGQPWIPKAIGGQRHLKDTVLGVCNWLRHRAEQTSDHPTYQTMELAESRGLIPREALKYAKKKGVAAWDSAGRVHTEPLRKFFFDFLKRIFTSDPSSLKSLNLGEGFEELDLDIQRARVAKEDADERARNNALANSQVHRLEDIEEEIWEKGLQPLRAEILNLLRRLKKQARNKTPLDPGAMHDDLETILEKIRRALPKDRN